ncbi:protein of unknown function [Paramicrobacterium humi]|uniref:HNH nuclease domain-containing protein n=1 Tax=Paramicrobacterium humi TaxID=640635 RepID=A0A1H4KMG9_9MICO|nr:HNH endonuclease signature motif containing protein [Microbacterium humi]SEB59700.1 protein of unknown function [Microbacterium humi]
MTKAESQPIERIAELASSSAAALLAALPHTAAAASDDVLLDAAGRLAELHRATEAALGVTAAELTVRSTRAVGADTLAACHGEKNAVGLLQLVTRMSAPAAKRLVEYGENIVDRDTLTGAPLPPARQHVAEAAFTGKVDAESVVPVLRVLDEVAHRADPDLMDAAEQGMMRIASESTPERTRTELRTWQAALDQDGARPREEDQRRSRSFRIGRELPDGMTPVSGRLTPDAASRLRAAISTFMNPRSRPTFLSEEEQAKLDELEAGLPEGLGAEQLDPRTRDQKMHDILDGLVTSGHRSAAESEGSRREMTQVIASVTLDELQNGDGVAWIDGMLEPLGPVTTERIRCDAGYRKLLLGTDGDILCLGDKVEFFTAKQKLAIAARDGGCAWPGCDAPASWCEVHHVKLRRDGVKTDVGNGMLLCSAHHHVLHAQGWVVEMRGGIPHLQAPLWMNPSGGWIRLGRNRAQVARRRRAGDSAAQPP